MRVCPTCIYSVLFRRMQIIESDGELLYSIIKVQHTVTFWSLSQGLTGSLCHVCLSVPERAFDLCQIPVMWRIMPRGFDFFSPPVSTLGVTKQLWNLGSVGGKVVQGLNILSIYGIGILFAFGLQICKSRPTICPRTVATSWNFLIRRILMPHCL